jgi:hypothetical protein
MRRLIFSLIRSSSKAANVPNRRAPHGLRRSQRDRSKVAAESRPLQMAFVCEQSGSVTIPNARRVSGSLRIRDQNSAVPDEPGAQSDHGAVAPRVPGSEFEGEAAALRESEQHDP